MDQPDPTTLAMGTDLTTLGLNLNSPEQLYRTFASPWADRPLDPEPEFKARSASALLCHPDYGAVSCCHGKSSGIGCA